MTGSLTRCGPAQAGEALTTPWFLAEILRWPVVTGGSDTYRDSVGKVIGPFDNVEACSIIRAFVDKYTPRPASAVSTAATMKGEACEP